ncbi:MAG: translation initiation factor IF-2 N-terminal domain-containing protein, partial [Cyanobacteriota bacterium]|nr:translation initiation factor IF-2 N-terminal domain-containing protein [Cyanobacteriota bacterium]
MTSSGKVRIYELSRDLGLDNKDVLDAAEKLSIAAKSHSSSISDDEAARIRTVLKTGNGTASAAPSAAAPAEASGKSILMVRKATTPSAPSAPSAPAVPAAPARPAASAPATSKPQAPAKPQPPAVPARPAAAAAKPPAPVPRPAA